MARNSTEYTARMLIQAVDKFSPTMQKIGKEATITSKSLSDLANKFNKDLTKVNHISQRQFKQVEIRNREMLNNSARYVDKFNSVVGKAYDSATSHAQRFQSASSLSEKIDLTADQAVTSIGKVGGGLNKLGDTALKSGNTMIAGMGLGAKAIGTMVELNAKQVQYHRTLAKPFTTTLTKGVSDLLTPIQRVDRGFSNWSRTLGGVASGVYLVKNAVSAMSNAFDKVDEFANDKARFGMIKETLQAPDDKFTPEKMITEVENIANRTRQSYGVVSEFTSKLGMNAGASFKNEEQLLKVAETVSKTMALSGASGTEQRAAMLQFQQALSSGRLQGDELTSILENAPVLANQIAKGVGISKGELKEWGKQEKLTTDIILEGLLKQGDEIDQMFLKLPMSFAGMLNILNTQASKGLKPFKMAMSDLINRDDIKSWVMDTEHLFSGLGNILTSITGEVNDFIDDIGTQGLVPAIKELTRDFGGLTTIALGLFKGGASGTVFAGLGLLDLMARRTGKSVKQLSTDMSDFAKGGIISLGEAFDVMLDVSSVTLTDFTKGFDSKGLAIEIGNFFENWFASIEDNLPSLIVDIGSIFNGLLEGAVVKAPDVTQQFSQTLLKISESIAQSLPDLGTTAGQLVNAVVETYFDKNSGVKGNFQQASANIKTAFAGMFNNFLAEVNMKEVGQMAGELLSQKINTEDFIGGFVSKMKTEMTIGGMIGKATEYFSRKPVKQPVKASSGVTSTSFGDSGTQDLYKQEYNKAQKILAERNQTAQKAWQDAMSKSNAPTKAPFVTSDKSNPLANMFGTDMSTGYLAQLEKQGAELSAKIKTTSQKIVEAGSEGAKEGSAKAKKVLAEETKKSTQDALKQVEETKAEIAKVKEDLLKSTQELSGITKLMQEGKSSSDSGREWAQQFGAGAKEELTLVEEQINQILASLSENFAIGEDSIDGLAQQLMEAISSGMSRNIPMVSEAFGVAIQEGLMTAQLPAPEEVLSSIFAKIVSVDMSGNPLAFAGLGIALQLGINNAVAEMDMSPVTSAIQEKFSTAFQNVQVSIDLSSLANSLRTQGASMVLGLAEGIRSETGAVTTAVSSIIDEAKSNAEGRGNALESAGKQLSSGMARGILAGRSEVINSAISVAKSAVQAAIKTLDIRSPSHVADKQIGQMFTKGIVRGVLKQRTNLKDAVEGMTGSMTEWYRKSANPYNDVFGSSEAIPEKKDDKELPKALKQDMLDGLHRKQVDSYTNNYIQPNLSISDVVIKETANAKEIFKTIESLLLEEFLRDGLVPQ